MIRNFRFQYSAPSDLANVPLTFFSHPSEKMLIQVFAGTTDENIVRDVIDQLAVRFPNAALIGTTTAGEILGGRALNHALVISLTCFDHASLKTAIVTQNDDWPAAGQQLGQAIYQPDAQSLIVFACGLENKRMAYSAPAIQAIHELFPTALLAGGQAGDNGKGEKTLVFTREGVTEHGIVAVSISGTTLHARNACNLSWTPLGKTFTVTHADHCTVFELDGESPYDIYSHYLGKEIAESLPMSAAEFPLMVERNGMLTAVNAAGLNPDGSFEFIHQFNIGDQVRFGFFHAGMLTQDAARLYDDLRTCDVQAAFVYSCFSRKLVLNDDIEVELAAVESLACSAGFFGYGEFFSTPSHDPLLLNATMTVLCLSEGNSSAAESNATGKMSATPAVESRHFRTTRALHHLIDISFKETESLNRELSKMARKDSLTGVANRFLFDERLDAEIKRHGRSHGVLSLIMLDVDHFKLFNDTYGHLIGDECLKRIARVLLSVAQRSVDLVARYGGEEFIIVLPETPYENALKLARKIQARIVKLAIPHFSSKTASTVTLSQGIVSANLAPDGRSVDLMRDLLSLADQQLYLAKTGGRNQICGIHCQLPRQGDPASPPHNKP